MRVTTRLSTDHLGGIRRRALLPVIRSFPSNRNRHVQGKTTSDLELKDVFFETPADFAANGGADGLFRHLGADLSNKFDVHIIDHLRNLFAPPDGVDLAAINIQRDRDLGLGTLNETREALGLTKYTSFDQITDDAETAQALKVAYNNIDSIDLWTGGLSETTVGGTMIGA